MLYPKIGMSRPEIRAALLDLIFLLGKGMRGTFGSIAITYNSSQRDVRNEFFGTNPRLVSGLDIRSFNG